VQSLLLAAVHSATKVINFLEAKKNINKRMMNIITVKQSLLTLKVSILIEHVTLMLWCVRFSDAVVI